MSESEKTRLRNEDISEDAPLLDVVQAAAEIPSYLTEVKGMLGEAITEKGGNVSGDPTFVELEEGIREIPEGKGWASGIATSSGNSTTFRYVGSTTVISRPSVEVSGLDLGFKPSYISISHNASNNSSHSIYRSGDSYYPEIVTCMNGTASTYNSGSMMLRADTNSAYVNEDGFCLPFAYVNIEVSWVAYE